MRSHQGEIFFYFPLISLTLFTWLDFDSHHRSQKNAKVVSIDSYEDVPANDEEALKKAVAHQPVSVAIEASGLALQLYQSVSKLFSHTHVSNCILPFINCDNWTHLLNFLGCIHWQMWLCSRPWRRRRWIW